MSALLPPPRGSSLHYATVFLPPAPRAALLALAALAQEIARIPTTIADPGVAQAKLAWWRAELLRLDAPEPAAPPAHPISQALADARRHAPGLDLGRLAALVEGGAADLMQSRFLDEAALVRQYAARDAALAHLAGQVLGVDKPRGLEALGFCLRRIGLIAETGAALRRGALWLPVEDLRRHELKVAELAAGRYPPGWVPLLREQAAVARQAWNLALSTLSPAEQRAARPLLILGAIALRLLAEIEAEDFRVLHQRVSLTPFTRFVVAARTQALGPRRE